MDVDIAVKTVVQAPIERVAGFVTNPRNDTLWIGGIRSVEVLTPGDVGAGARVRRVAAFLGRSMEYTLEVRELAPGKRLEMVTDKPFEMTISYDFGAVDHGTLVRVRVRGNGVGFYRLAAPLLSGFVRRDVQRDLRTLKRLLEAREVAGAGESKGE